MARSRGTAVQPAGATTGTALSTIDAQLQSEVASLRQQLDAPAGNKIKVEVKGSFTLPDGLDLGDSFEAVVIDFYNRNHFFLDAYDQNSITPPDCFAVGKIQVDMAPPDDVPAKQSDKCLTCWANQFKSAPNGKAKACQNRFWLAVRIIDPNNPDAEPQPTDPIYVLDLSPTNRKSFEGFATYAATSLGAVIKARVTISAKNVGTYAAVTFSDPLPNPHYALDFARRAEAEPMLTRGYDYEAAKAAATPVRGGRGQAQARRNSNAQQRR